MNSGLWHDLKVKVFKSGDPVLLYIGINTIIFVVASLLGVLFWLTGYQGIVDKFITTYLAFPSDIGLWPTRFYTVFTYQFFHKDFFHVLFNLLWLYWMGQIFMSFLKARQFHFVYLLGGIFGAIAYALVYNLVPVFRPVAANSFLIGSSAAVMAIFAATATLVPDYTIRLMFIGSLKIKYLLFAYIVIDIIAMQSYNAGGSLAHLGGGLFGFVYIKMLKQGHDLSNIFKRKPKLRVVKKATPAKRHSFVDQKEIDAILDKVSKTGYDKLSRAEKETLFKASNN